MNATDTTDDDCPTCGATHDDRVRYAKGDAAIPLDLSNCPHCGALKCCQCDMGDDVECMSCEDGE